MSDSIDKMANDFKEASDLQSEIDAQFKVITELNRKINDLSKERDHLKSLLESSVPLINPLPMTDLSGELLGSTDEELICVTQITKLNQASSTRELTLEECRKFEIYSKILSQIRSRPKTIKLDAKKLGDGDLLEMLNNGESSGSQA